MFLRNTNVCQCVRRTGGELLLTQAAIFLLHLDSDATFELGVPVPLPRVHFVLENTLLGDFLSCQPEGRFSFNIYLQIDVHPCSGQDISDLGTWRVFHCLQAHAKTPKTDVVIMCPVLGKLNCRKKISVCLQQSQVWQRSCLSTSSRMDDDQKCFGWSHFWFWGVGVQEPRWSSSTHGHRWRTTMIRANYSVCGRGLTGWQQTWWRVWIGVNKLDVYIKRSVDLKRKLTSLSEHIWEWVIVGTGERHLLCRDPSSFSQCFLTVDVDRINTDESEMSQKNRVQNSFIVHQTYQLGNTSSLQ